MGGSESILGRLIGWIITLTFVAVAAWLVYALGPSLVGWLHDYVW